MTQTTTRVDHALPLPAEFYQQLLAAAECAPPERHARLSGLHTLTLAAYTRAVRSITSSRAAQTSSDGRTIAQVVGHISAWDRYTILAAGEMIGGVQWPSIMRLTGYKEPDGVIVDFLGVDDFNAYHAELHADQPWQQIQHEALENAAAVHALFTGAHLLTPSRLEATAPHFWRLAESTRLALPTGWYLWMVTLEHAALEHAADLGIRPAQPAIFD